MLRPVITRPANDRPSLPIRAALLWALAALLLALAFTAAVLPNTSPSSDVWDYAQEARQLSRGEGFTSLYTYPTHLRPDEDAPFPVRWRMPLYAVRGALGLGIGVPLPLNYYLAVAQGHAILVMLVFLLGSHLHSSRAGAIAAAAAIACPLFLDAYSPAMSQVPTAALSLLVWLLLLRWRGAATAVLAALAAAAAWYLRGESLLMAPLWIWAAARGGGARRALLFGGVYAALCAAWPLYLTGATGSGSSIHGNPMLLYTPEYPGYSSARTYGATLPDALPYVLAHPGTFIFRWIKDVLGFGLDLLGALGPIAIGLAIAGLLLRETRERYASLRPTIPFAIAIALQVAAFAALERSPRFLVPIAPLVCVMVGIAAAPALDRICGRRMVAILFALLIAERVLTIAFQTREAPRRFPPLARETASALAAALPPAGITAPHHEGVGGAAPRRPLILTDAPDWVAWHLDRPALLLPMWRDLPAVLRDHEVAAVFLTPGARARNAVDGDTTWVGIIDRGDPIPGFAGPRPIAGGSRVYVRAVP
jgi:hypothetical protein